MRRRTSEVGDGDVCPLNPEHGQMMFLQRSDNQYCPDHSHEGVWNGIFKQQPTRAFWPKGRDSFRRAVLAATLPEIDISILMKGVQ